MILMAFITLCIVSLTVLWVGLNPQLHLASLNKNIRSSSRRGSP